MNNFSLYVEAILDDLFKYTNENVGQIMIFSTFIMSTFDRVFSVT